MANRAPTDSNSSSSSLPTNRTSAESDLYSIPENSTTSFERKIINEPKADSRFYSGRNPVPRISSLWELHPFREESPDPESQREEERKKKIEEHSTEVTDPITGKRCVVVFGSLVSLPPPC